jgi:type II secretion system protein J
MNLQLSVVSCQLSVWNSKTKVRGLGLKNSGCWLLATGYYSRGFTLVEILVASTILGVVLAALYGVFSRTLESKRLTEERTSRARSARIVLFCLGEDLQASFSFARSDSRFIGETRRTNTFPEGSLSFVSFSRLPVSSVGHESDVSKIAYSLIPDPQGPGYRQLVRQVSPDPGIVDPIVAQERGSEAYPLLSRVRGLRFRFFDGQVWRDEWGQNNTKEQLPRAVEATLYLDDSREEVAEFSLVVELPLAVAGRGGFS